MNRRLIVLCLSAFVAVASLTATSNDQEKARKGFLSVLKEGQSVSVKEVAGRFEITLMKDVKLGHHVVEIGPDYLVIEDIAGVTETRIHVTSIKAIVRLKLPKE